MQDTGKQAVKADPAWKSSFIIDKVHPSGQIRPEQHDHTQFTLASTIKYLGETGLEGKLDPDPAKDAEIIERIRTVAPKHLKPFTDLVSVPKPMRWYAGRHGDHTAAALIHDRFIGRDLTLEENKPIAAVTDEYADRYFRFMLKASRIPWVRRWVMWAGVAFRTRMQAGFWRAVSVVAWALGLVASIYLG